MTSTADFADRLTAAMEEGHAVIADLRAAAGTGAPVSQASVNTLAKVFGNLTEIANDTRRAASEEQLQRAAAGEGGTAPADVSGSPQARPQPGTAAAPGTPGAPAAAGGGPGTPGS